MYTITIKYVGITTDLEKHVASIAPYFGRIGSYIDSSVFVGGNPGLGDGHVGEFGKSVYATNVKEKFGYLAVQEPYASTGIPAPAPLASMKVSEVGTDNTVTFETADYKEAFYFQQMAGELAKEGFEVTVTEGDEPTPVTPSITLDKDTATVAVNATVTITATTVPDGEAVEWTSSDDTKAEVADGVVTGKAAGDATITAKITVDGTEYTATCVVTVE